MFCSRFLKQHLPHCLWSQKNRAGNKVLRNISRRFVRDSNWLFIVFENSGRKVEPSGKASELVKMNGERYVGVALDYSPSSRYALEWAIDNCVRQNDHLIVLVVNKDSLLEGGQAALWEASGTPFIPLAEAEDPHNQQNYQLKLDEELKKTLHAAAAKKIVVVFKVYWGDPKEKLCSAVVDAPLDFLVMGCRGLSALKRTILGSVSNYVTNNVPCPVTIVKLPPS